ncbi:hypothetical protein K9M78_02640 [Candidatus Bipolaricaulota bacterium]|nr:hypothetical protein [Candidatus Bipolaricaulota bacterium]
MENNHKAELDRYMDSGEPLHFVLANGIRFTGVINWQDDRFVNIEGSIEGTKRNCTISKNQLLCYYEHFEGDDRYDTIEDI